MPLILPDQLIDQEVLNQENIFTMTQDQADHQDIRPIKILIVNLMPKKRKPSCNFYGCCPTRPCK